MRMHCPHCGVKGVVDDSYKGKEVRCPECEGLFEVQPENSEVMVKLQCPNCGVAGSAHGSYLGREVKCPQCEEKFVVQLEGDKRQEQRDALPVLGDVDLVELQEAAEEATAVGDHLPVLEEEGLSLNAAALTALELDGEEDLEGVEQQPYGIEKEQCWQCGKESEDEEFSAQEGRLYCSECLPKEQSQDNEENPASDGSVGADSTDTPQREAVAVVDEEMAEISDSTGDKEEATPGFSIVNILSGAWIETKGVKGPLLAGSLIMYLIVLPLSFGGSQLLPEFDPEMPDLSVFLTGLAFQLIVSALYAIFFAGLLYIGIRKIGGETFSWKMTFVGFRRFGNLVVVSLLQSLLIFIGFLLLVLPGIYLIVGYSMSLALIIDKQMSPWQAMETSRKAIHKVWWRMALLMLIMVILLVVAAIPAGIGLIWIWPMFIMMYCVVYYRLFKNVLEEPAAK